MAAEAPADQRVDPTIEECTVFCVHRRLDGRVAVTLVGDHDILVLASEVLDVAGGFGGVEFDHHLVELFAEFWIGDRLVRALDGAGLGVDAVLGVDPTHRTRDQSDAVGAVLTFEEGQSQARQILEQRREFDPTPDHLLRHPECNRYLAGRDLLRTILDTRSLVDRAGRLTAGGHPHAIRSEDLACGRLAFQPLCSAAGVTKAVHRTRRQ